MPAGRSRYLSSRATALAILASVVVCPLLPHRAEAATPPTAAIIAKLSAARAEQARSSFSLSLTIRDGKTLERFATRDDTKPARCADGRITLERVGGEEGDKSPPMILSKDAEGSALAIWLLLCEPNPLEVLGSSGGLIASEVEILADDNEIYYQLGTSQKIMIAHALDRVLGLVIKRDKKTHRVEARGRAAADSTLPGTLVAWEDGRQVITATLSLIPPKK